MYVLVFSHINIKSPLAKKVKCKVIDIFKGRFLLIKKKGERELDKYN